jgi:hypothetical protein
MACFAFATDVFWFRNTSGHSHRSMVSLTWLQDIRTETEAVVKKCPVFCARGIEILNQTQQPRPIEGREPCLDFRPRGLQF